MTRSGFRGSPGSNDSYYISLADLLIGLIFIFMILLVASAMSLRGATERADRLQVELNERVDIREKLLNDLRADMQQRGITIRVEPNGVLRLPEDTLFASGEAVLGERGRGVLRELAAALAARLPCYGREQARGGCPDDTAPILEAVYVEGHTDNVPILRRGQTNWELSSARAIATYRTLREAAPALETMRNVQDTATLLGVSAYADQRPARSNDTEAGRRENRRIDLRFLLAPVGAR